jgi:5'-nucleotidase / UDP-sugar diphosphatase
MKSIRLHTRGLLAALLLIAAALAATCAYVGPTTDISGQDVRLTILHTSDIHSRILPFDYAPLYTERMLGLSDDRAPFGGLAQIATIIKRERHAAQRSIWVDSGDVFQGAPIFNIFGGEPEIRALSEAGLDAMALGNHEFDAGPANAARQLSTWAAFPVLAANYRWEIPKPHTEIMREMVKPFVIRNIDGLRVAIIGMGNTSSMYSLGDADNSLGVQPVDFLQITQQLVDELKGSADLVMLLSHLGLTEDLEVARNVCGIDVIMGGHHHVALDPPAVVPYAPVPEEIAHLDDFPYRRECANHDTIVSHPQAFAKFVGRLDLIVHDGDVKSHDYTLIPVDNTIGVDAKVWELLEPYYIELNRRLDLDRILATAEIDLKRFGVGGGDSMLGNFVAEAMQLRPGVETDFCVTNSLGIRTDVQEGDILLEHLFNVLPFENTITTMYLSGREVQDLLDYATRRSAGRGCSSQIQVSGITFTMNCKNGRAEDILINEAALNPGSVYEMATNDYIADGGSGFDVLARNTTQNDTGISMRAAVIDYLARHPVLPECDDGGADLETCTQGVGVADGRIKTVF